MRKLLDCILVIPLGRYINNSKSILVAIIDAGLKAGEKNTWSREGMTRNKHSFSLCLPVRRGRLWRKLQGGCSSYKTQDRHGPSWTSGSGIIWCTKHKSWHWMWWWNPSPKTPPISNHEVLFFLGEVKLLTCGLPIWRIQERPCDHKFLEKSCIFICKYNFQKYGTF